MGFGILLFGYLLAFPASLTFFYSVPIAAVLTAVACRRLARVNRPFGLGFSLSIAVGVASVAAIVLRLVPATERYAHIAEGTCLALLLVLTVLLLTGLEWVFAETGLKQYSAKAFRNKIFTCLYLIPTILLTLASGVETDARVTAVLTAATVAFMVVGLVVQCLNALLIFNAYRNICMPEDLNMPRKPSRFAFINRHREAQDKRREEELEALRAEAAEKGAGQRKKKK